MYGARVGMTRSTTPSIDLTRPATIDAALQEIGAVDAVICVAAHGALAPAADVSAAVYDEAIRRSWWASCTSSTRRSGTWRPAARSC